MFTVYTFKTKFVNIRFCWKSIITEYIIQEERQVPNFSYENKDGVGKLIKTEGYDSTMEWNGQIRITNTLEQEFNGTCEIFTHNKNNILEIKGTDKYDGVYTIK